MAALNFNPLQYDPIGEFTVFPAGWYPMAARKSEVKAANSNQSNGYLQYDCEILDGPHKGQTYQWRFNLYNQNEQARDIANRMLATLCFACGVAPLNDSSQLHGIPFQVLLEEREMDYRPNDDRSKPKRKANEVTAIRDIHGNAPGKPGNGAAGSSGAPSSAPGSAPMQPPAGMPPAGQPAGQPAADPSAGWQPNAGQPAGAPAAGWGQPPAQQPPQQPQAPAAGAPGGWQPPAAGQTPPPAAPWGPPTS